MAIRYRVNGGEIVSAAISNIWNSSPEEAGIFDVALSPSYIDDPSSGNRKIYLVGANEVRDATAPEIAAFDAAIQTDTLIIDRRKALQIIDIDPVLRKLLRSILDEITTEFNRLRTERQAMMDAILTANNLGEAKTNMQAVKDTSIPTRSLSDLRDLITSRVNSGVND